MHHYVCTMHISVHFLPAHYLKWFDWVQKQRTFLTESCRKFRTRLKLQKIVFPFTYIFKMLCVLLRPVTMAGAMGVIAPSAGPITPSGASSCTLCT